MSKKEAYNIFLILFWIFFMLMSWGAYLVYEEEGDTDYIFHCIHYGGLSLIAAIALFFGEKINDFLNK